MPDYGALYEQRRLAVLERVLPRGPGLAVDIGCNDGTITDLLREHGYRAVGFDIDSDMVRQARLKHPDLDIRQGSAEHAEEVGNRDLTLCLEVIEHLPGDSQGELLRSIARATRPGGNLVLSTPGRYSLVSSYERARRALRGTWAYNWWDPTHVGVLSWRRLRRLIQESGFTVQRLVGFHYLPPRVTAPFALENPFLARLGFDLIVLASRR